MAVNHEGFLYKYRNRLQGWEYRYFRLTKSYFQYYEAKHSPSPKKTVVRTDIVSVSTSPASTQRKYPFEVITKSDGTWYLDANTLVEREKWIPVLRSHLPPHLSHGDDHVSHKKAELMTQERETSPDIPIALPSYAQDRKGGTREPPPSYDDCL